MVALWAGWLLRQRKGEGGIPSSGLAGPCLCLSKQKGILFFSFEFQVHKTAQILQPIIKIKHYF